MLLIYHFEAFWMNSDERKSSKMPQLGSDDHDATLVATFEMLVDEISNFDTKVCKALSEIKRMGEQQRGYTCNAISQTRALLAHFSTRKGIIDGSLAGLDFGIEKCFDGEASCAIVGSLFVRDPNANDRLLDAVARSAVDDPLEPFGEYTAMMSSCFTSDEVHDVHERFMRMTSSANDHEFIGSGLTCRVAGIHDATRPMLGEEMIVRFLEKKYRLETLNMLSNAEELESVRAFKAAYPSAWQNVWFVPNKMWLTRDVFACLTVFVTSETPLSAMEFAKFVRLAATGIMRIPAEMLFRLRVHTLGKSTSVCLEANELAAISQQKYTVMRLCGLISKALSLQENCLCVHELVQVADTWYSDMILDHKDVLEDIKMFRNAVQYNLQSMLEQKVTAIIKGFMLRKFNMLSNGMKISDDGSEDGVESDSDSYETMTLSDHDDTSTEADEN